MPTLTSSWKAELVLLSYGISVLGCLAGVYLSEQFRLRTFEGKGILKPYQILALMSISIGGIGVWAMHFIGMHAILLKEEATGREISLNYDVGLTSCSLFAVIACVYLGIYISTRDRVFMKNSAGVADMLLLEGKNLSFKEARSKGSIRHLAVFKGLHSLVYGGVVIGAGICIMHYVGMMAQVGDISMKWDAGVIFASVVIAVVVATVALWIMFRLLSLYPLSERLRVSSALVMGVAACGMHYTGMYGATFESSTKYKNVGTNSIDANVAGTVGLTVGLLVSIVCIMLVIADLRAFYHHANNLLSKYETIVNEMEASQTPGVAPFVQRFRQIRDSTSGPSRSSLKRTGSMKRSFGGSARGTNLTGSAPGSSLGRMIARLAPMSTSTTETRVRSVKVYSAKEQKSPDPNNEGGAESRLSKSLRPTSDV